MSSYPAPPPAAGQPVSAPVVRERVGRGLFFALGAVLAGMIVAVVLWRFGFIAGLSSFVIAGGATALYVKGAGALPRYGLGPLVVLIVVGVVLSFFACVASDLYDAYGDFGIAQTGMSRPGFIAKYLFDGGVLSTYQGKDLVFFIIFALLGTFGSLRRIFAAR